MSDSLSFFSPQFNNDILFYFLTFLDDPLDLVHMFGTNKQLSTLASNPYLWQNLLHKYFRQEVDLYASAYKNNPFELFKNLYLFRLKQYYMAFALKTCTKEDFLLFLNINHGYMDKIQELKKVSPQKMIKIHGMMMSQKNFEEIEAKYNSLSKKEREIAGLVAHGLNTSAIANKLHISEKTVRNHLHSIYGKLDVKDRLALANFARPHTLKAH